MTITFSNGSDVSDCGQYEVGPGDQPVKIEEPVATEWERDLTDQAKASRTLTVSKIQCTWCSDLGVWKITDPWSTEYACTMHGTEWWPDLFPEPDTECMIEPERVSPVGVRTEPRRPWYPLVGHRSGLKANDLVTLASALFVLALEGGTAHV